MSGVRLMLNERIVWNQDELGGQLHLERWVMRTNRPLVVVLTIQESREGVEAHSKTFWETSNALPEDNRVEDFSKSSEPGQLEATVRRSFFKRGQEIQPYSVTHI